MKIMRITEEKKDKLADLPENYVGPEFEDTPFSGFNWQIRAQSYFDHDEHQEEEDWIEPSESFYYLDTLLLIEFHPIDRPFRENAVFLIMMIAKNDTEDVAAIHDILAVLDVYDNALTQFHTYTQQVVDMEEKGKQLFRLRRLEIFERPTITFHSEAEYREKYPAEYAILMEKHPYKPIKSSAGDDLMDWSQVPIVKEEGDKAFIPVFSAKKIDAMPKLDTFEDLEQEIKKIMARYEQNKSDKEAKTKALRELVVLIQDIPKLSSFEKEKSRQAIAIINKALVEIASKKYEYPALITDAQKWYVFNMRIIKKTDLKGQFTDAQIKAIPFQKLKGAWIAQSWVWENYPQKIVDKLPIDTKFEPVSVLAVDYGYVFKIDLPEVHYVNENLLYIEPGAFLDIKVNLRNQNNLIYTDQIYHEYRQNITHARMESLKAIAGTDSAPSPESAQMILLNLLINQISDEQVAQKMYGELAYYLGVAKYETQKDLTLSIAGQEHEHEIKLSEIKAELLQKSPDGNSDLKSLAEKSKILTKKIESALKEAIIAEQEDQAKYPQLAKIFQEYGYPQYTSIFLGIASQEAEHEQSFTQMLKQITHKSRDGQGQKLKRDPFPFDFCQDCEVFGKLRPEDQDDEYDRQYPEVCRFWNCDSLRPDACPKLEILTPKYLRGYMFESELIDKNDERLEKAETIEQLVDLMSSIAGAAEGEESAIIVREFLCYAQVRKNLSDERVKEILEMASDHIDQAEMEKILKGNKGFGLKIDDLEAFIDELYDKGAHSIDSDGRKKS